MLFFFLDEIDQQRREMYDIERIIRNMQNDVLKLNTLLHQQKNMETSLEASNILFENDFIGGLKVSFKRFCKVTRTYSC